MAELAPNSTDVNDTFGVLFLGFIFGVILYGLTFFQTYVFYSRFPNESLWVKCTVALLWSIDTTTTALLSHMQYFYLITSFLVPWERLPVTSTFMVEKALAAVAIFVVQSFFITRVRSVTGNNIYICGIIGLCVAVTFALGIVSSVQLSNRSFISALVTPRMRVVMSLNEGVATVCDIIIVGAIYYCLRKARHPAMRTPSDWFERGILMVVNRGTLFTFWQMILFITVTSIPHSQVWIFFHFILSKIYINTLFSMLNSRKSSRGRGINEEDDVVRADDKTPAVRSHEMNPLDFGRRHGQTTIELEPVTARDELGPLDINARGKSSLESETLAGPISPSSVKALSLGPNH